MPTTYNEPPHPTQVWKITGVRAGKVTPNPKGPGNLRAFYCDMEGTDDGYALSDGAYWRRMENNTPTAGEEFLGTVSVGDYGLRFSWDSQGQAAMGTTERAPTSSFEAAAGKPAPQTSEAPDARQRSIVRQSSQKQAIEFLKACVSERGDVGKVEFTPEWLEMNLSPIIDWFQADSSGASSAQASDPDLPF